MTKKLELIKGKKYAFFLSLGRPGTKQLPPMPGQMQPGEFVAYKRNQGGVDEIWIHAQTNFMKEPADYSIKADEIVLVMEMDDKIYEAMQLGQEKAFKAEMDGAEMAIKSIKGGDSGIVIAGADVLDNIRPVGTN